jgi:hypothetical protein
MELDTQVMDYGKQKHYKQYEKAVIYLEYRSFLHGMGFVLQQLHI